MTKLRIFTVLVLMLLLAGCYLIPQDKGMATAEATEPVLMATELPETTEASTEAPAAEAVTEAPTTEAATEAPETEAATESPETEAAVSETEAAAEETRDPNAPESFLLSFVGDCTLGCHTAHVNMGYGFLQVVGDDYAYPFQNVLSYFEQDDLTFANLEGTLNNDAKPAPDKPFNFRGPESYVNILTENSIEVVSLANNHAMDYGPEGYEATTRVLEEAGVNFVERDSSTIVTSDRGLTVGIYAAMYYKFDPADMVEEISRLAEEADLVIYAPHWGVEGSFYANGQQINMAHQAIDAGADIVWGHHPHVLQRMEKYNDGIICYSMGNFCFGGNMYPPDMDSAIIQMEILKAPDGTVTIGEISAIPVSVSSIPVRNNFQPTPYAADSQEYARVIRKLDGSWRGSNLN